MERASRLHDVLLLIAAAAIAGPVWAVFVHKPPRDYYRALAETSCKCARTRSGETDQNACWRGFDAATNDARANAGVTPCFPLSETSVRLPGGGGIVISWDLVGADEMFCTREEAIAAEGVFAGFFTDSADWAGERHQKAMNDAMAALKQLSRDYAKGERITTARAVGCVSGMQ